MPANAAPYDDAAPPMRPAASTILPTLLILVGLLLVLSPPSGALQEISFELDCPSQAETVQPLGNPVHWDCTARFDYLSAGTGMTDPVQPGIIGLEAPDPEPWMRTTISPSTVVSMGPNGGEERVEKPVTVSVSVTADAPAFQTTNLWIEPHVIQHPREEGELSTFTNLIGSDLTLMPGYVSLFDVRVHAERAQAQPQEPLLYTIQIDNYSNGPTRFDFNIPEADEEHGFMPLTPQPIFVPGASIDEPFTDDANTTEQPSNATRTPTTVNIPLEVYTPYRNGYVDERIPLDLEVVSSFAPDQSIPGERALVSFHGQTKGVYIPSAGLPLLVLATVGAVLLAPNACRGLKP